jgi:hypothetical protein
MLPPWLLRAHNAVPLLRALPPAMKRWLVLHLINRRQIAGISARPSRRWLEHRFLPAVLAVQPARVLFVGVAPYTWRYVQLFTGSRTTLITNDIDPKGCMWGARDHVLAPVQSLNTRLPGRSIDVAIASGIFGDGVNSPQEKAQALTAIRELLVDDGVLLVGWSPLARGNPMDALGTSGRYRPAGYLEFPQRTDFPEEQHIYDLYRAAP